jgi:hypothetical protein
MNRKNIILNVFQYFKVRSGPGGRKKPESGSRSISGERMCRGSYSTSPQCGFFVLFLHCFFSLWNAVQYHIPCQLWDSVLHLALIYYRGQKGWVKGIGEGGEGWGRDKRLSNQAVDKQLKSPSLGFGEIDTVCHKSKVTLPECS